MKRRHAILTSLLLGVAVIVGSFALTRTMALGQSTGASEAQIARRSAALDHAAAQVRLLRAQHPPRLPASTEATAATRIVVRGSTPAHADDREHSEGSDEHETEGESGWDD